MALTHKFDKVKWDASEAKKKAGKDTLKNTLVSSIQNVPDLRAAVKLLLDAEGIEYKT